VPDPRNVQERLDELGRHWSEALTEALPEINKLL
jgi:hypothetical protein